jgi:hypothetical protein
MSVNFNRPTGQTQKQDTFSDTEVGINHPFTKAFLRFCDNGDIHLMVSETTGIIMSPSKDAILLVGNVVKFLTNDEEGLRWNQKAFNPDATTYSQPALVPLKTYTGNMYANIEDYLG